MSIETEIKIKEAARKIFREKGFAATRTRDIADEAGINLALLNYYFKGKQQLFKIIMMEEFESFFQSLYVNINDEKMTLREKLIIIAEQYINTLEKEHELPFFIISEVHSNPEYLMEYLHLRENILGSHLLSQFKEHGLSQEEILNKIINALALIVFPFIARPMFSKVFDLEESDFSRLIEERKRQIPEWIDNLILKTN